MPTKKLQLTLFKEAIKEMMATWENTSELRFLPESFL